MRVFKQASIYFITYAINAGISVIAVSYLTHYLSPSDYGVINLYSSFILLLTPFISGGTLYPISVEFFKKPESEYPHFFSNVLLLLLIILGIVFLGVLVFSQIISSLLHIPVIWVIIAPFVAWLITINEITIILARDRNQPLFFAVFSMGKTITDVTIALILIILFGFLWQGRLSATILAPFLFFFFSVFLFRRWKYLKFNFDRKLIRSIFFLSFPYVIERFSVFILSSSDRFFIDSFDKNGTSEVGLYGVGSQIAAMNFMVIQALSGVYQPYIFKRLSSSSFSEARKGTLLYILGCFVFMVCLYIAIPFVFRFLIGQKFHAGIRYAYILTGAYFFWSVYYGFLVYLLYNNKSRLVLYISVFGVTLSLGLNTILVRQYGAWGATITAVCVYFCMALVSFFIAKKFYFSNAKNSVVIV